MSISVGNKTVQKIFCGNKAVKKVFVGNKLSYTAETPIVTYRSEVTGLGSQSISDVHYNTTDALANWNFEEITDSENNVFCKIPTMYRKITATADGQITGYIISNQKEDDGFVPYPCFIDAAGVLHPYLLIGKYMSSTSSKLNSVNATNTHMPPSVGLRRARAWNDPTYFPYDWRCQKLLQDLFTCKKKTVNFNPGTTITSYMGIAHLNEGHWVFGANKTSDNHWAFCYDPAKFIATDSGGAEGTEDGYYKTTYTAPTSNYEIQKLSYETGNGFFNYPNTVTSNSSYNTYYCDLYYYASGNKPVYSRVGDSNADSGPWHCNVARGWSSESGVRLCRLP